MPRRNLNTSLSRFELFVYRIASIVFLILMLIKLLRAELTSW